MSRTLKISLIIGLAMIAVLTFVFAHWMVAPGDLMAGHTQLNTDCFACHSALTGADSGKCVTCHKLSEIGRLSFKGTPILKPKPSTQFHQELNAQNCVTCHSDHKGVMRYKSKGQFNHALLKAETNAKCQACHQLPSDSLHKAMTGNCTQCHSQTKWRPASFDHNAYFALDEDHVVTCVTCHLANDYKRYTCYGCHEHTLANIRSEHMEEGIRQFNNCVECHGSGNKHDIKGGKASKEGKRGKREDD